VKIKDKIDPVVCGMYIVLGILGFTYDLIHNEAMQKAALFAIVVLGIIAIMHLIQKIPSK